MFAGGQKIRAAPLGESDYEGILPFFQPETWVFRETSPEKGIEFNR
jgi:hypothetical protein